MSSAVMPAAVSVNRNPIQQRRSALHPSLSAGRELVQGAQRCCDLAHIGKEACPEIHSLVVDECSGRQQWANSNSPKTEQSARLPCMLPGDRDAEMIKIQSKINENLLRVPRHCSYPVDLPALTLSLMLSARVGEGGTSGFFLRHGQTIEAVRPRGEEQLASVYRLVVSRRYLAHMMISHRWRLLPAFALPVLAF